MTALTERLRHPAYSEYVGGLVIDKSARDDMRAAADEIERLHHALHRIVNLSDEEKNKAPPDDSAAQVIARDALAGHYA